MQIVMPMTRIYEGVFFIVRAALSESMTIVHTFHVIFFLFLIKQ
jgi:hypothetical protein